MSLFTKTLLFGALALGTAEARGGGRQTRFGRVQSAESDQVKSSRGRFGRGADADAEAAVPSASSDRGSRKGRGGSKGSKGSCVIALEKIQACEDDLLLACSLEFTFDMDDLQDDLADFEADREAAKEDMAAWLESSMEGEKPTKPELTSELKGNLKAIRKCLHDVVKDTLSEDSECAAALTHTKPEDEVVEEPGPVEETADSELAK